MAWFRIVALAVALACGLACASDEAKLAEHIERGEAYLEEDKPAEAIIEYKNALQLAPNDAAVHFGLARAFMASKQPRKAFWSTRKPRGSTRRITRRVLPTRSSCSSVRKTS